MTIAATVLKTFRYDAQNGTGRPIAGTIQAATADEARELLESLQLRILAIEPEKSGPSTKPLNGDDFFLFNQQLAQLSAAGMPIESGLRLIADDMAKGRLAATVRRVADDLAGGKTLDEAFRNSERQFPPLYAALVEAGIRTGNLPAMLFSFGKHLELVQRLRATLWRVMSYPIFVLLAICGVIAFIGMYVLPQFAAIFSEIRASLPAITEFMLYLTHFMPAFLGVVAVVFLGPPLLWLAARIMRFDRTLVDYLVLPLPLIGRVLSRNLVARWCDALTVCIEAGMDLSGAMRLAAQAVGSPRLSRDVEIAGAWLESGRSLAGAPATRLLPPGVLAAMSIAAQRGDLPQITRSLAQMYQLEAETRMETIPVILTPILFFIMAVVLVLTISALVLPTIKLISAVSGGD